MSDCHDRSLTNLGTSTLWDPKVYYTNGFLAGVQAESPNFYNWNRFDLTYCDGSFHQGLRTEPVEYNGTELFFRGSKNVETAVQYIKNLVDFNTIEQVVVMGGSTGGYATFTWSQYINDLIKEINGKVMVLGVADSGFFVDYYNYKTKDRDYYYMNKLFYEIVNKDREPMINDCLLEHSEEKDLCLFPEYFVKFVKVPILIIQSGYDSSNLFETVGLECVTDNTLSLCDNQTQELAHKFKNYQNNLVRKEIDRHENFSVWAPACVTHCYDDKANDENWEVPEGSGMTANKAIEEFLKNPMVKNIRIEEGLWPENKACSGV